MPQSHYVVLLLLVLTLDAEKLRFSAVIERKCPYDHFRLRRVSVVVPRGGEHYLIYNMSTISTILLVRDPRNDARDIEAQHYLVSKTLVRHAPSSSQGARVTIEKVGKEGSPCSGHN